MKRAAPQPPRRLRTTPAPPAILLALGLALAAPLAAPLEAAHPFYEEQLRRGRAALDRGDHAEAARTLRLAAFGLLDEPPALAGCLVHLALARHALGDTAGVREAVERVLALEERFGAYRAAALPESLAGSFAALALEAIPPGRLAELEAFADLARGAIEEELEALPAGPRRERLEELLAAEPAEPRWALLLGRLELAAGRFPRAAELAGRVVAADPASQHGLCLRGLARAGASDCAGAAADLAGCDQARTDEAAAVTYLSCLDELERWREAEEFAAVLPPALRANRRVARLARRAARKAPEAPAAEQPSPADASAAESPPGDEAPPPAASPDPGLADDVAAGAGVTSPDPDANGTAAAASPVLDAGPQPAAASRPLDGEDADKLARARAQLAAARTAGELDEAWALAREVADRRPDSSAAQHLAAEIAYLSSRWSEAVRYFRRGGDPERPEQLFYLAVALHESGAAAEAVTVLEKALPRLRRTPFVDGYVERILGPSKPAE